MARGQPGFGAFDGAALVITTVVGAGIFTVPTYVAGLAGGAAVTLGLWLLGGVLALAGALCYAELGTRIPRGGAEYAYLRSAFGEPVAFLSGWTSFVAGFSGAIAAAAVGFASYLAGLVPSVARLEFFVVRFGPITVALNGQTLVAVGLIAVFTVISVAGVRASRAATTALALLIVAGVLLIVAASAVGVRVGQPPAAASTGSAWSALVPIFFTYSGWNAAAYVAGEFRDPARGIPRAMIGGTLTVTVLYVAINAALLWTLSPPGLASADAPVARAADIALGATGGIAVTILVLTALGSSVCAMVITGPRIYAEMANDGVLPRFFAPSGGRRPGVPVVAVIAQSVWSALLVLSGTFAQIVTYTGFSIVVFSGLAVCALIVLRRRDGAPRIYGVPWYPWIPVGFVLCCVAITVASIRYAPGPSLSGAALILAGLAVRRAVRPRARAMRTTGPVRQERAMASS